MLCGVFMVQKPLGLRILSVSIVIVSLVFLVFGYRLFALFKPSYNLFVSFQGVPSMYWLSLVFMCSGVFGFVLGLGLWGLRRWAYYLALISSVVIMGFGGVLIVEAFNVLFLVDVLTVEFFSVTSLIIFGFTAGVLLPLMFVVGLFSIAVGVVVLRYLTGDVKYSFY